MSHALLGLVSGGGILAIFVLMALESAGIPISSEIIVPLGGALASGALPGARLDFTLVVAAASLGNLAGSLVAYGLARRWGVAVILSRAGRRLGLHEGHLRLADRFFDRFGLLAVFLGRLLPVVRTYVSFPAGVSRIRTLPFSAATILGAIPWNLALAYAGFRLGQSWDGVERTLGRLTAPAAVLFLLLVVAAWWFGRRLGEETAEAPAG
jgi:membrane protein DedA with SNARE-associated domain